MAKITDLNEIRAEVISQLAECGGEVLDFLTLEEAANCITMIYLTNDVCAGFGQDYANNPSIVSSQQRIAIIYQGHHSFYKSDLPLCEYTDLVEDIESIRITLDAALARWSVQCG